MLLSNLYFYLANNLKANRKILLLLFIIGCLIRIIPELIAYPYPIGYDVINYYIPLADKIDFDFVINQYEIYPFLLYIIKTLTFFPDAHILMIGLSSITYGIFSISIYLFLQQLNVKLDWLITIFILFQISALRTTWDLQKDILALSFTFFIFYIILKNRKISPLLSPSFSYHYKRKKVINFCLIISLVVVTILTDTMISFLLIISLSIYFIIKKDKKYVISLVTIIIIVISFLILIADINNNQVSRNINTILNGTIKEENLHYYPLNLAILFIMINGLLLPFLFYGIKYLRELLLYIPLGLTLIGSFTWLVLPYSSILLPDRWIILSGIFISIFSAYGLVKLFSSPSSYTFYSSSKSKNKPNYKILVPIISVYILIGLFYMILPTSHAFPIYGLFFGFTQHFVPTTMQFNAIDIVDNKDLVMAIDWLNNNTDPNSIIYGGWYFKGWMETLLKDQRIFEYHNMDFSNNGIYILLEAAEDVAELATEITYETSSINYPIKLLFSQGTFKIIEK